MSLIRTRGAREQRGLAPAERARTLIAGASALRVGVLNLTHEVNRHTVGSDGSLLLLAPVDSPGAVFRVAPRLPPQIVTVTTVDVASVPQLDRIRGTLRLTGPMRPASDPLPAGVHTHLAGPDPRDLATAGPVLRLQPSRVSLTWHCEDGIESLSIPVEDYQSAFPDPVMEFENRWLPHLHRDHSELLRALAVYAHPDLDDLADVRPLSLDRFGLVLRMYADDGRHQDTRLSWGRPVACGCEIRDAFNDLLHRASPNTTGFSC